MRIEQKRYYIKKKNSNNFYAPFVERKLSSDISLAKSFETEWEAQLALIDIGTDLESFEVISPKVTYILDTPLRVGYEVVDDFGLCGIITEIKPDQITVKNSDTHYTFYDNENKLIVRNST